jgi:predicted Zn finger-like uncharacterized protein
VQAICPQCSQKIAIDDARVPDRPFSVRCPKCQTPVKLPGRGQAETGTFSAATHAAAPPTAPAPAIFTPMPSEPQRPAGDISGEEAKTRMVAELRREMGSPDTGGPERALIVFPNPAQGAGISQSLTRLGYAVDSIDDFDEGARQLEQGAYAVVATARVAAEPGRPESLYQRIVRLSPEARRKLFVILVGDEFRTGDSTQSFVTMADLVLHTKDSAAAEGHVRAYQGAKRRLFQPMEEARKRVEASAI